MVATPIALANLVAFLASGFWGWMADNRPALGDDHPGVHRHLLAPLYLFTTDPL